MFQDDLSMKIATFRFGVIADFVTRKRLERGEQTRLLAEKASRHYDIPGSTRTRISQSTILLWVAAYKKAGFRIEGLLPKRRKDRGSYRKLDAGLRMAIKELKAENPNYTLPVIIHKLRHRKILGAEEELNKSSIYRFIKLEGLNEPAKDTSDRRKFEAPYPNDLWQCDVLHGPMVKTAEGTQKKSYLLAIIDDYSRLIVHAQFYLSESFDSLKDSLRQAVSRRGLPSKFYVDNGACYRATHLEQILAALGIGLAHSRPYTPQGRGKIERWFRYVRQDFIPVHADRPLELGVLNERLESWVDRYNDTPHSSIKEKPYDRFRNNLSCIRPAPDSLMDYFRKSEIRRVRKDRTVQLYNQAFEVPVGLIDRTVELRFHPEAPTDVEVFFENRSYGKATILDAHVNARVGRDWYTPKDSSHEPECTSPAVTSSGQLFGGNL